MKSLFDAMKQLTQTNSWIYFIAIAPASILLLAREMSSLKILLLDRFFDYGGFLQIIAASFLSVYIFKNLMKDENYISFRKRMWIAFSITFFLQLFAGILISNNFLLTGALHFPIPFMIISGGIWKGELNFMIILFAVTILISGGAWCSHLCYFGGMDFFASGKSARSKPIKMSRKKQWFIKLSILFMILLGTIILKQINTPIFIVFIIIFSIFAIELFVITILSRKKSKMIHCAFFCPIGTITSIAKYINPRRLVINNRCTSCMSCTMYCKYSAIKPGEIKLKKMDYSCTHCGDCSSICKNKAIEYKIFNLNSQTSKKLNMAIIAILYTVFIFIAMV